MLVVQAEDARKKTSARFYLVAAFYLFFAVSPMKAFPYAEVPGTQAEAGIRSYDGAECLVGTPLRRAAASAIVVGALAGEGIGPEVVAAALETLASLAEATGLRVEIRHGGLIGKCAESL